MILPLVVDHQVLWNGDMHKEEAILFAQVILMDGKIRIPEPLDLLWKHAAPA